jgi:hypothetical protein
MRTPQLLIALLFVPLIVACPPDDDDDTDPCDVEGALDEDLDEDGEPDCSDTTPTGVAPVIESITVCEVPVTPDWCEGDFAAEFRVSVTDEDCNFDNPPYSLTQEGNFLGEGRFEGSLGCGGLLRIQFCNDWARGFDFAYQLQVRDDLENDSNLWEDTWFVPVQTGDDNCAPL